MSNRFSAIDIGSNAIRLIIGEWTGHEWIILKKERSPVRLGADAFSKGFISEELFQESLKTFKKFQMLNRKFKVDECHAVATSALRESKNARQYIQFISKKSNINIQLISGEEEGLIIRDAICGAMPLKNTNSLFIDIGGGSMELTFNDGLKTRDSRSFKMGTVRTLQRGPLKQCLRDYEKILKPYIARNSKNLHFAVGTGGNIESLGRLKLQLLRSTPNTNITLPELKKILSIISRHTVEERMHKLQMRSDRADVIIPALNLLILVMELAKVTQLKIPYVGLRDGILRRFVHS